MLDYLGEKSGNQSLIDASMLIDRAVSNAFAKGRLRPMEFGGDQGTKALTKELLDVLAGC